MGFVIIFPFCFVNSSAVKVYINPTTNPALYLLKTPENQRLHFQVNMVINIVGNKMKGANLKIGVTRKQSTSDFLTNEHFLPPETHTCVCV